VKSHSTQKTSGASRLAFAVAAICCMQQSPAHAESQTVRAGWYGAGEGLSHHTANGELFNPNGRTAAHRTLPFGTRIEVSYRGRTTTVRINDRGPLAYTGCSLDLSRGAAAELGLTGTGEVAIRILDEK
jgi:rare lipoprotein A